MKILSHQGFQNFSGIINQGIPEKLLKIEFDDSSFIKATPDHKFLVEDIWVNAFLLDVGDILSNKTITNIEEIEPEVVYDMFKVEEAHSYYSSGVYSHNCSFLYIDECVEGDTVVTILKDGLESSITIDSLYRNIFKAEIQYKNGYKVLTENGFKSFDGIKRTIAPTIEIIFSDDSNLKCTKSHLIKTNNTFTEAINLNIGDAVGELFVKSISKLSDDEKYVYDLLNVADGHHYITNNVTSHNCAFVEGWVEFYKSVYPTISSGQETKVVLVSCVTKDTIIYTNTGMKFVEEFIDESKNKGYYIAEYNIQGHSKTRSSDIFFNNGFANTKIIKTKSGSIESSLPHKYWAYSNGVYGWIETKDLKIGDYLASYSGYDLWGDWTDCSDFKPTNSNKIKNRFEPKTLTPDICYIIGIYLAEGSSYKSKNQNGNHKGTSITLTCGDSLAEVINKIGLPYSSHDNLHYTISSIQFGEFLEYLGFDLTKKSKTKIIPSKFLTTSKENLTAFLQGYFDGDGTIGIKNGKSRVAVVTTSKVLANQIKCLLLNYGIYTALYEKDTPPTKNVKVWSHSYCLELNYRESLKFNTEIGFRFKRKSDRINLNIKLRKGSPHDIVPNSYNILKKYDAKCFCFISKKDSLSRHKLIELKEKLIKSNYRGSSELKEFFEDNVSENIKWEIIKDIKDSENHVYDFSLPNDDTDKFAHSVIYNGFIGHQTPNGLNFYYKLWDDAVKGKSDYIPIKVTWKDVPGRDEEWKRQTIANTSEEAFIQEHEAEFIGSAGTLIDGWRLKELVEDTPIRTGKYSKMYEEVIEGHIYALCADVSRGKGIDNSAYIVVDVTNLPYKIVSTYYCPVVPPDMFAEFIYQAHIYYNDAFVVVENNDAGCETLRVLNDTYECESILGTKTDSQARKVISINGGNNFEFGVRTTKTVKAVGCTRMKQLIESGSIQFGDRWLIDELNKFIRVGKSYEAQKDAHDDIVMTVVIFSWLTTQYLFEDLTSIDTRFNLRNKKESEYVDDLLPFGYVIDGLDTYGDDTRVDFQSIELPDYEDTEFYPNIQNRRKIAEEDSGFFDN